MTNLSIKRLAYIAICVYTVTAQKPLVTKQTGPIKKPTRSKSSGKDNENDVTKERYTSGICKEGADDIILYNMGYLPCLIECRSRDKCTGVNVYSKTNICRLNFETNLHLRSCPKYIYSEKANWKWKSVKGCEDLHCNKNQRCSLQPDGPVCVATECPNIKYLENGVIFGGHVRIGSKRGFRCNHGYHLVGSKAITCQPDGGWSPRPPSCLPSNPLTQKPTTTSSFKTGTTMITDITTTPEINTTTTTSTHVTSSVSKPVTSLQQTSATTWIENQNHLGPGQYNSPCGINTDCLYAFSQCRQYICKCVFGTVYHMKSGECVKDCVIPGGTFQKFINISVTVEGDPMARYDSTLEEDCINLCLLDDSCTALTMVRNTRGISTYPSTDNLKCIIYNNTLRQIKNVKKELHLTYVRDCREITSSSEGLPIDVSEPDSTDLTTTTITTSPTTLYSRSPLEASTKPAFMSPASLVPNDDQDKQTTVEITSVTPTATETTSSDESDVKSKEIAEYITVHSCYPGFVYSYHTDSCENGCRQNADTFQKYSRKALDFVSGKVGVPTEIRGLELTECFDECFKVASCIAVVYDLKGPLCGLIRGGDIPPPEIYINAESELFVRDCSGPTHYIA